MDLRKEVLYYDALVDFPANGQENKLYLDKSNGALYYWDGLAYALSGDGKGNVLSVTASAPLASSGGANPNITLTVPSDNTKFLDGTGAFDTVKDSDLSLSDITTNNVSTTKHGFVPKAPNDTTKFLRGDGTWDVPASGGLTEFTEAETTATPNATVPVNSLTPVTSTTNADFAIIPKGTGAFLLDIPDNAATGGNKRGQYAIDLQMVRSSASQVASGSYSFLGGGVNNTAASLSAVVGGNDNTASGGNAFAGGAYSSATGQYSLSYGYFSTAGGAYSYAIGRQASATNESYAFGWGANASGQYGLALGTSAVASGVHSVGIGFYSSTLGITGRQTQGYANSVAGDCQKSLFPLSKRTTDATATTLTVGGGTAGTTNQVILSNNSAYGFNGTIVGKQSGSTNACMWKVTGLIARGANAASTTLTFSSVDLVSNAPGWGTPTLAADTTNGGLQVQVVGLAATNIQWTATIETTEVIYA
jgi:hypothetical protein